MFGVNYQKKSENCVSKTQCPPYGGGQLKYVQHPRPIFPSDGDISVADFMPLSSLLITVDY